MNSSEFSLSIHMVSSLDGFIAKKDNSVSWFETMDHYENGEDYDNTADYFKDIDCFVMGSYTYELAEKLSKEYGWVYGDVPTIVVSSRKLVTERQNIEFYSGDLNALVEDHLKTRFKNVWMVGGASLTRSMIQLNLATEIKQTILPILLGEGKLFYENIGTERKLHLKNARAFKSGMVELSYDLV